MSQVRVGWLFYLLSGIFNGCRVYITACQVNIPDNVCHSLLQLFSWASGDITTCRVKLPDNTRYLNANLGRPCINITFLLIHNICSYLLIFNYLTSIHISNLNYSIYLSTLINKHLVQQISICVGVSMFKNQSAIGSQNLQWKVKKTCMYKMMPCSNA